MRKTILTALLAVAVTAYAIGACAELRPVARTVLDIAREACDVFLVENPKSGMSLDDCAQALLSADKAASSK